MLTEQEVLANINERLVKKSLKSETIKYTNKLKELEALLNEKQKESELLKDKIKRNEAEIHRLRGAISILLELSAESEGLLNLEKPK